MNACLAGVAAAFFIVGMTSDGRAQSVRHETDDCVIVITAFDNQGKPAAETETTRADVNRVKAALELLMSRSADMRAKVKEACQKNGQTHGPNQQLRDGKGRKVIDIKVFRGSPGVNHAEANPASGSFSGPGSIALDLGDIDTIGDHMTEGSDPNLVREIVRDALKRNLAHEFDHLRDGQDRGQWGTTHGDPLEDRDGTGEPVDDENRVIAEIGGNVHRSSYGGDLIPYGGRGALAGTAAVHRFKDQMDASHSVGGGPGGGYGTPLPLSPGAVNGLPDRPCGDADGAGCYPPASLDAPGAPTGPAGAPSAGPSPAGLNPGFLSRFGTVPGIQTMLVILPSNVAAVTTVLDLPFLVDESSAGPIGCPPDDAEGGKAAAPGTRGEKTPDLNGGPVDCAMVAVANNLIYLAETHGIPRGSDEGQLEATGEAIIASLRDAMGWEAGKGVPTARAFLEGKQAYIEFYKLPIKTTEVARPTMENIRDAISDPDKAVEIDLIHVAPGGKRSAHAMTLVGANGNGLQVHDPKTKGDKQTDSYETSEARDGGGNQFVALDGYAAEGVTLVSRMYVQEYVGEKGNGAEEDGDREPGGSTRSEHRPRARGALPAARGPEVLIVSTGLSTGSAFEAIVTDPDAFESPEPWVAEPLDVGPDELARMLSDLRGQGGVERTLDGYCLQLRQKVPPPGMVFRLASAEVQERYAATRRLRDGARELFDAGDLHPDSDPEGYFHSTLQWAIWSKEEGFDQAAFARAFLEHTKTNALQAGEAWTSQTEEYVRGLIPNRWNDIQAVLGRSSAR